MQGFLRLFGEFVVEHPDVWLRDGAQFDDEDDEDDE